MAGISIGEFFINLGVKGDDKSKKKMSDVDKGLKDMKESGIAAKAILLGTVYALERLFMSSANQGARMEQFANLTQLSTQELQKWEYAAEQSGSTAEEMNSSIVGLQKSMSKMLLEGQAPKGLLFLQEKVGFDFSRINDTFYMLQKLRQFANEVKTPIGNEILSSFGLSDATIASFRNRRFDPEHAKYIKSDKMIQNLAETQAAFKRLERQIDMQFSKFTAAHGKQIINDVSSITESVFKLTDALVKMGESLKVFKLLGMAAKGVALLIDPKDKQGLAGIADFLDNETWLGQTKLKDINLNGFGKKLENFISPPAYQLPFWQRNPGEHHVGESGDVNIEQNLYFQNDGTRAGDISKAHKDAARQYSDAYRQQTSQGQGP